MAAMNRISGLSSRRSMRYNGLSTGFRCQLFQCPVCWQDLFVKRDHRFPTDPIRRSFFRSASIRRSRFPVSVPQSDPAGFPTPAGARGRPTSPHVSLSSSDKPNQQHCTHRSRSDWRSRRLHPYLRSLFTDFLHCGAANCGVGLQSVHYDRAPDFVDFG